MHAKIVTVHFTYFCNFFVAYFMFICYCIINLIPQYLHEANDLIVIVVKPALAANVQTLTAGYK